MTKDYLNLSSSLYRDEFKISTFSFGKGKEALSIVAGMRGNEVQQLYTASLVIRELENAEKEGLLDPDAKITVIPSVNPYSMNIAKRFYPIDNSDINRMFPGYSEGETTQRIAGKVFDLVKDYEYGIHLASNYMAGDFMSHINIMDTGWDYTLDAKDFGIRYIVIRESVPYDTTTLNYNWQIWNVKAFSLYTTTTDRIDISSAERGVSAIMAFLSKKGILKAKKRGLYNSEVIRSSELKTVRSHRAGFFFPLVKVEDVVRKGDEIGFISDPLDSSIKEKLYAPEDGVIYFLHNQPLCYGQTAVCKIIPL